MIAIYKITNPKGKIYIGQTVDVAKRKNNYKNKKCVGQRFLYHSILKYGFENHIFEVLEECKIEQLNEKERYWQDFYNVLDFGLNLKLTTTEDKTGYLSKETKDKMSKSLKGRIITKEWREKLSKAGKNKILNENQKKALIKASTGRLNSKETNRKIAENNPTSKLILDFNTGVYYYSVLELSRIIKVNGSTLFDRLTERKGYINKSQYKIV